MKKVNVKFDKNYEALVEFVKETKEGKYTIEKPEVVEFTYQRINIQEQNENIDLDSLQDNSLLYGITS